MPSFDAARSAGLALPGVTEDIKYDGSPLLKVSGRFMAGLAMHRSAEPDTLVVRVTPADREGFLADAPETYYLTDHYRRHPVVLVRLGQMNEGALRELLTASWRLTRARGRRPD